MGMSRLLADTSVASEHPAPMTAIEDWLVGTSAREMSALKSSRVLVLLHCCEDMNKDKFINIKILAIVYCIALHSAC